AAFVMFSAFMFYDDEGYVLISLRNFAGHGGLYRDVYTQYGPFPHVLHAALHTLGLPFTHVAGRLVTLFAWAGAAVLSAALVRQATRSLPATLAVLAATFSCLWIMANEPSHPGGLIALVTALMAAAGHRLLAREQVAGWAALSGATVAALALTKINVGGFAGLSVLSWMLLHARSDLIRRCAPALLMIGAVLLPIGLMRPLLGLEWTQIYALVFACSAIAVIVALLPASRPLVGTRALSWSVISGLAVTILITGLVLTRGTGPVELINGVLIRPLRQPASFSLRFLWPAGTTMIAIGSLLLCGTCAVLRRRGSTRVDSLVAALRLAAAIGAAVAMIQFPAASPNRLLFAYAAPCLWIFLWPLAGEHKAAVSARLWPGLLLLGQFLHPFPVAGSQIAWGIFLALPIAGIGGIDAARWLQRRHALSGPRWRAPAIGLKVALAGVTLWLCLGFGHVASRYRDGSDLRLPGAEPVRLPSESAALYRILTLNVAVHSDMLFSEPGMFSFNLLSGVKTPTLANVTHWFSLLNGAEQQRIIAALEATPRACVIVQRTHVDFLRKGGFAPAGELHDYIAHNFSPAFTIDGFEFCVRNGRTVAPLMLGEMLLDQGGAAAANRENTSLQVRVLLPSGGKVEQIEVASAPGVASRPLILSASNARIESTSTDLAGRPIAAPVTVPWPLQLDGPATLRIHFDRHAAGRPAAGALITFRGINGEEVALARLKE
ncbi:MAG: hypothetical protein WD941_03830, partial [Opitutus sp.]